MATAMMQHVLMKSGGLAALDGILEDLSARRILLVTGKSSYRLSGAERVIDAGLGDRESVRFDSFSVNPRLEDVKAGLVVYRHFNPDVIVAVGGGSAIDMAKLIAYFSCHDSQTPSAIQRLPDSTVSAQVPIIAIPTTAGSGSEATHFAVLYINGQKRSVASPNLLPRHALIDASLGLSMPPYQKAVSGLDATCQAIESMWAVEGTAESREHARMSLSLLWEHLPIFVRECTPHAAENVFQGAYLAGRAINISKTTACHAISYPLTWTYGMAHGHAVGLLMPPVFRLNSAIDDINRQAGVNVGDIGEAIRVVMDLMKVSRPDEFGAVWRSFLHSIGLTACLRDTVDASKARVMQDVVSGVSAERLANNPRKLSKDDVRGVIEASY